MINRLIINVFVGFEKNLCEEENMPTVKKTSKAFKYQEASDDDFKFNLNKQEIEQKTNPE